MMSLLVWAVNGLARHHHLQARRSRKQVHQKAASSVVISMACRLAGFSSPLSRSSLGASRAVVRLRSGQSLLPFSSRASYCWTQTSSIKQHQTLLVAKAHSIWRIHPASVFSTSVRHDAERKDEEQPTSKDSAEVREPLLTLGGAPMSPARPMIPWRHFCLYQVLL